MQGALHRTLRLILASVLLIWSGGFAAAEVRIGAAGSYAALITAMMHDYRQERRHVSFRVLPDLGNSGAMLALRRGFIDIAVTTRKIEPDGKAALRNHLLGRTPVVFVTSWQRPGLNLTRGEIVGILGLDWTAWPDGTPVRPILRPPMENSYRILAAAAPSIGDALERAFSVRKLPVALTVQENLDLAEEVKGSFTVACLSTIRAELRDLTVVSVDGVEPTPVALAAGTYPFAAHIHIAAPIDAGPDVHSFIDHFATAQSQALLLSLGVLPADED